MNRAVTTALDVLAVLMAVVAVIIVLADAFGVLGLAAGLVVGSLLVTAASAVSSRRNEGGAP